MQLFMNNSHVDKRAKITYLMNNLAHTTNAKFGYMMDMLGSLKAVDVIPQLINKYQAESDANNKSKMIGAITESAAIVKQPQENNRATMTLDATSIKNVVSAQQLIMNVLLNEQNPSVLHQAIDQSFSLLPMNRDNYYFISEAMKRLEQIDHKSMTLELKYLLLLSMALLMMKCKHGSCQSY